MFDNDAHSWTRAHICAFNVFPPHSWIDCCCVQVYTERASFGYTNESAHALNYLYSNARAHTLHVLSFPFYIYWTSVRFTNWTWMLRPNNYVVLLFRFIYFHLLLFFIAIIPYGEKEDCNFVINEWADRLIVNCEWELT